MYPVKDLILAGNLFSMEGVPLANFDIFIIYPRGTGKGRKQQ